MSFSQTSNANQSTSNQNDPPVLIFDIAEAITASKNVTMPLQIICLGNASEGNEFTRQEIHAHNIKDSYSSLGMPLQCRMWRDRNLKFVFPKRELCNTMYQSKDGGYLTFYVKTANYSLQTSVRIFLIINNILTACRTSRACIFYVLQIGGPFAI